MKKIPILFVLVFALFFCIPQGSAEASEASFSPLYTVRENSDGYMLISDGVIVSVADELDTLLESIPKGDAATFFFDKVKSEENLTLYGRNAVLTGAITFSGNSGLVIDGGRVEISGAAISFSDGNIRIKRGELIMSGGSVSSRSTAVISDFSDSSSVKINGGSIYSKEDSALRVDRGSLCVSKGSLTGRIAAIEARTGITLLGSPALSGGEYDVLTDTEITLFSDEGVYRGEARVKLYRNFERGRATVAAYAVDEESLFGISLFDLDGVSHPLVFRDRNESGVGEAVGMVELPYFVTFYDGEDMVAKNGYIKGRELDLPPNPQRVGYSFFGWCTNSGELYDFSIDVTSDISVYSSFTLTEPTYTLVSCDFTYDGESRKIAVTDIRHPLLDCGFLSYEWFKDGVPLASFSDAHYVRCVSDSGSYCVKITLTVGNSSVSVTTPPADVVISKKLVTMPTIPSQRYTGFPLRPDISDTDEYTVAEISGILTGIYPVAITLSDSENYEFMSSDEKTVYVDFVIEKGINGWTKPLSVSDIYEGESLLTSAASIFGTVEILYRRVGDSRFFKEAPTESGEYIARAFVLGDENFTSLDGVEVTFKIIPESVEGISVSKRPYKELYKAFELFEPSGIEVLAMYNSGRIEAFYADFLSFSYQSGDSFRYGDSGITVGLGGKSVTLPLTVEKAEYDMSNIKFESVSMPYCGALITIPVPSDLPVGLDGIKLIGNVRGAGTSVGEYELTLEFSTASRNYKLPSPIYATLTVTPLECEAVWIDTEFVYDGGEKTPTAFYIDVYGRRIDAVVKGSRSLAGEYTATLYIEDENYKITNFTCSFVIAKADYDMSKVFWQGGGEVYDGAVKSVYITNLPVGVTVVGYVNNRATDSGSYTARAALSYDRINYNPPIPPDFKWQIVKREYDTDGFYFADVECVYDGLPHYPTLVGSLPVGLDGIALEYVISRGVLNVSEGKTQVAVTFKTESKNYIIPDSIFAYVTVFPKEINISWSGLFATYNGRLILPTATADECGVTLSGGGISVGEYDVLAVPDDSNYTIANSNATLTVLKAENRWTVSPTVGDIFYGREPVPKAVPLAGEVEFVYYYGDALDTPLAYIPHAVGSYAVVAYSPGDENHFSIESEPLFFEIITVVPVSIDVELDKSIFPALVRLDGECIKAYLRHNDGLVIEIPFELLDIEYQRGENILYGDGEVTVKYGDFSKTVEIVSVRADYNMESVRWEGTFAVYDGEMKCPYLSGLPDGVSVSEYVGGGTLAGEYTVRAILEWDRENCNPPSVPDAVLTVAKRKITTPIIPAHEYNGDSVLPSVSDTEYYTVSFGEGIYPGRYPVVFTVRDGHNYEFDSGSVTEVDFVIEKRKLIVEIDSVELMLFEKAGDFTYKIILGELLPKDTLNPKFAVRNGKIYAEFDMPYYDITVIEGEYIRTAKISEKAAVIILAVLLALITFGVFILIYIKRIKIGLHARHALVTVGLSLQSEPLESDINPSDTSSSNPTEGEIFDETNSDIKEENSVENSEQTDANGEMHASYDSASNYTVGRIETTLSKDMIHREIRIKTEGYRRGIINVDTLSESFSPGERVDINILKRKSLIPYDTAYIKVLARGVIDKPLVVYANDFSLSAVKMIAIAGGRSIKVVSSVPKNEKLK